MANLTSENRSLTVATARESLAQAAKVLQFFPCSWPMPEISNYPEAAGGETVDFEWCAGHRRLVTVWMSEDRVSWAGMFDDVSSHGRCGEPGKMPPECYALVQRVVEAMSDD